MSNINFTVKELRMLVDLERKMDANEVPWVRVEGCRQRALMRQDIMNALGLITGQTISMTIYGEILRINLEQCEAEIAYERGQKLIEEETMR